MNDGEDVKLEDKQIIFTGKNSTEFPKDLLQLPSVTFINISHNQFSNIGFLSAFNFIVELNLDNNCINEETKFPKLEHLQTLSLNNNKISKLAKFIKALSPCSKNLEYLGLLGNPMCPSIMLVNYDEEYASFRCKIIRNVPSLKFLDWKTVQTEERKSNIVKHFEEEFSPLPVTQATTEGKGSIGKIRYSYIGKQSEGNRFIRNYHL